MLFQDHWTKNILFCKIIITIWFQTTHLFANFDWDKNSGFASETYDGYGMVCESISTYRKSLYLETKALVQSVCVQWYGLSPVWEYECTFSFSKLLKAFSHNWQEKFFLTLPSTLLFRTRQCSAVVGQSFGDTVAMAT